jgi:hypothetical protein
MPAITGFMALDRLLLANITKTAILCTGRSQAARIGILLRHIPDVAEGKGTKEYFLTSDGNVFTFVEWDKAPECIDNVLKGRTMRS